MQYPEVAIQDIRNILKKKCKKHVSSGISITRYPVRIPFVYREFWRRWVVCYIVRDYFERTLKPQNDKEEYAAEEQIQFLTALLCKDMNRMTLDGATYAWLTIDNFRWHTEYAEDKEIPTDLSYELVTQYFPLMTRIGLFVCGLAEYAEYSQLDEEYREMAKTYALESTLDCLKGKITEQKIMEATANLHY